MRLECNQEMNLTFPIIKCHSLLQAVIKSMSELEQTILRTELSKINIRSLTFRKKTPENRQE